MATKNASYIKSQIIDDDDIVEGFVTDDNGMRFLPETDVIEETEENQFAYATHTHMVNDTNNPIWNQVSYDISSIISSSAAVGHVTLQGVTDDGTINDLMQHRYTASSTGKKIFDMFGSSCTNALNAQIPGGSAGGVGTFDVTMPMRYEKYEDVDIMASWYDSDWDYRMAMPIQKSLGKLHNATGRNTDYYGIQISVPYAAHMTDGNFTDIRFTANDGITELDFYILNFTASTMASVIVMVPWWFIDKEREPLNTTAATTGGIYANPNPSYIYCYYGNASASSASDITLGGNTYFYDDFEDADYSAKWTASAPAGSSVTETGGYVELQVNASTAATPSLTSIDTGADFDGSDSFEVIWTIDEISHVTGTTANQGPIFRVLNGLGDYVDCRFYSGVAGTYDGVNEYHWKHAGRYGSLGTEYPTYITCGATTTDRYLKLKYVASDVNSGGVGYGKMTWYMSFDGSYWDVIGTNNRVTATGNGGGPITGNVSIAMYEVGAAALAASQYVRIKNVIMYPIAGNDQEWFEDHFTNGTVGDRWEKAGTSNSTFTEESATGTGVYGTPGQLRLSFTNASKHEWTHATQTCPIVYTQTKTTTGANHQEVCIYQTKINAISTAVANNFAGIFISEGLTAGTHYALRWGVNRDSASAYTLRYEQQTTAATTSVTMTQVPTLPCYVRIVLDPFNKTVAFDYSSDELEWLRLRIDKNMYSTYPRYAFGKYMGLFCLATTQNSGGGNFDSFKAMTGLRESVSYMVWDTEESYATYPIEPTTPDENDMTLTFATPAGMRRNNAITIRTKPPGGDYNKSKIMYLTDDDLIKIGPDGTDKYMGMRLEFDFEIAATDTVNITGINYIYEVL